jgi:hypothetical protein
MLVKSDRIPKPYRLASESVVTPSVKQEKRFTSDVWGRVAELQTGYQTR